MAKKSLINTATVITTAVGGILLFLSTVFLNVFISAPPTRAEFDTLKERASLHMRSIDGRLRKLEDGQSKIINHLLKE